MFGEFSNHTGWSNPLYVGLLGLLLAQYTFSGYDASAHLSEETVHAQVSAARGIVFSIFWSWVVGFVLLAGMLFAIQDYAGTVGSATGVPRPRYSSTRSDPPPPRPCCWLSSWRSCSARTRDSRLRRGWCSRSRGTAPCPSPTPGGA